MGLFAIRTTERKIPEIQGRVHIFRFNIHNLTDLHYITALWEGDFCRCEEKDYGQTRISSIVLLVRECLPVLKFVASQRLCLVEFP